MKLFLSLFLLFGMFGTLFAQDGSTTPKIPTLTSPVMDQAGFLSEAEEKDLSDLAYEIHTHNGPQVTILTVPDLQGFAIEDFSIQVAEKWKLGTKAAGNGLLVLISKNDRQMRIEVGQGIEGEITDYDTSLYTREIFPKYFREGNFHGALRIFLEDVAKKFNIKLSGGGTTVVRRAPVRHSNNVLNHALPFLVIVLVISHLIMRRRPLGRGLLSGAGMAGVSWFMFPGVGLGLGVLFVVGFFLGLIGISNLLFALASGGGGHRGGGFGGGGGGGWGGGGGGFSGGGSSGSW